MSGVEWSELSENGMNESNPQKQSANKQTKMSTTSAFGGYQYYESRHLNWENCTSIVNYSFDLYKFSSNLSSRVGARQQRQL